MAGYALTYFPTRYYLKPSLETVVEAMRLANERALSFTNPDGMARMFARVAQREPALRDAYAELAQAVGQRSFVGFVLALIEAGEPGDPLAKPIASPRDLDPHWDEFFLTGDHRPVVRLIDVLEWPDLLRERLVAWLHTPKKIFERSRAAVAKRIADATGIRIDVEQRAILSGEDLDCAFVLDGLAQRNGDSMKAAFDSLPFRFEAEPLTRIAMKGSALWSLASNAGQHALVNDVCAREAARRSGTTRRALEQITAHATWVHAWPMQLPTTIDVLHHPLDHPVVLDMLWAHYFATGDAAAVRRIISALEHLSDHGAAAQFRETKQTPEDQARAMRDALFEAASRSLVSLMKEHAPLFALCEQIFDDLGLSPNERVSLALIFEKLDPVAWHVHIDPVTSRARVDRKRRKS
jgi:hypothetical protein